MLNRLKKVILILGLCTILFSYNVNAEPAENNVSNNVEPTNIADNENTVEPTNENDEQSEIHSTSGANDNSNKIPNSHTTDESQSIKSYSTVTTLPEANLGLNNILNVILIALGILMVLLGIAILIKLKN